jgi:hypothetical protein
MKNFFCRYKNKTIFFDDFNPAQNSKVSTVHRSSIPGQDNSNSRKYHLLSKISQN